MAISRDEFFENKAKGALWDVGVSIKRGNPLPLDADSVFDSYSAAEAYVSGVLAYPGQILAVVEAAKTTIYYISEAGKLVEVGAAVKVDNKSIILDASGLLTLKGLEEAQTGAYPSKKADGTIEWVKPDTTTVEGLTQAVEALDGRVETVETTLGNEGSGLVKQVNDLQTNLTTNYYDKSAVDGLVAGAFHFKGKADKYEDGNLYIGEEPIAGMKAGDVYQVEDKEYAYTGTEWIELGFTIDLSNYATTSWTTQQINAAKTELQSYADQAETDAVNAAKSYTDNAITNLASDEDVSAAVEAAKKELKTYADQAKIEAIQTAGTEADQKINTKVGELGAEYSTVKQYVDAKDSALDGKISSINSQLSNLGTLAQLDEVAETNLASALKSKIDGKADKSTTLAGYGITDAMTATAITGAISIAKDEAIAAAGSATDTKISTKIGEITPATTVKEYVDNKETALNGKISTIQSTIGSYGDIVTHSASEFEKAGAANAVLGTSGDESTANTVYGAKKGVEEAKAAAQAAKAAADGKVASVTAADASVTVGGSGTAPTVKVAISAEGGNALKLAGDGLKVEIDAAPEYTIEKDASAQEGFFASYTLKKNGVQAGEKINIPKDYLVKSASVKESAGEEDPSGLPAGTKYIDFVVNTSEADGQESHIYLNVNELVDVYTAGNGIDISGSNVVSTKVVAENGLSVDTQGIKLAAATTSTPGAMSAADKLKLDGLNSAAQENVIETISINGENIAPIGKDVGLPLATALKFGVVKVDNVTLETKTDGILSVKQVNVNQLVQTPGEVLIIDCGSAEV